MIGRAGEKTRPQKKWGRGVALIDPHPAPAELALQGWALFSQIDFHFGTIDFNELELLFISLTKTTLICDG